jgi:branched-chain amino acid transport system substrate-binding protein
MSRPVSAALPSSTDDDARPTPIRIGEINSYSVSVLAGFTRSYRMGIDCAVDLINRGGGVIGRRLEMCYRDDALQAERAVEQARSLLDDDGVDFLAGTFNSDLALEVARFANTRRVLFFASEPRSDDLIWDRGSRYTFRLKPSVGMYAEMLAQRLVSAPQRKWANMGPDYPAAYRGSQRLIATVSRRCPHIEWVDEYVFPMGALDVIAALDWMEASPADGFLVGVLGSDLQRLAREGQARGTFAGKIIADPLAGEPEYLSMLGQDTPEDWLAFGYPSTDDLGPRHAEFRGQYIDYAGEEPTLGSLLGFTMIQILRAAIEKAGTTATEPLVDALEGLEIEAPFGPLHIRRGDHQATMGAWVGQLTTRAGQGALKNWVYHDGADYLPDEAEGARRREPARAAGMYLDRPTAG